jgi:CHAD domain-containing protein
LRDLRAALHGVREGAPKSVHEARIAIRRLRGTLDVLERVFERKPLRRLRRALAALGRDLGSIRDLDVLQGAANGTSSAQGARSTKIDALRARACARLATTLDSKRMRRALVELKKIALVPGYLVRDSGTGSSNVLVRDCAGSVLLYKYEIVQAHREGLDTASSRDLHRLRVEAKRLRYALELFEDALGAGTKALIATLIEAQDQLGALQDAEVALELDPSRSRTQAQDLLRADMPRALAPLMGAGFRRALLDLIAGL